MLKDSEQAGRPAREEQHRVVAVGEHLDLVRKTAVEEERRQVDHREGLRILDSLGSILGEAADRKERILGEAADQEERIQEEDLAVAEGLLVDHIRMEVHHSQVVGIRSQVEDHLEEDIRLVELLEGEDRPEVGSRREEDNKAVPGQEAGLELEEVAVDLAVGHHQIVARELHQTVARELHQIVARELLQTVALEVHWHSTALRQTVAIGVEGRRLLGLVQEVPHSLQPAVLVPCSLTDMQRCTYRHNLWSNS